MNLDSLIQKAADNYRPPRNLEAWLNHLPPDERAKIDELVHSDDPRWTDEVVAEIIREHSGGQVGSPSAVGRYRRARFGRGIETR